MHLSNGMRWVLRIGTGITLAFIYVPLIVIGMIPPLLVYPFVQKHFVKGAMIGSLKG